MWPPAAGHDLGRLKSVGIVLAFDWQLLKGPGLPVFVSCGLLASVHAAHPDGCLFVCIRPSFKCQHRFRTQMAAGSCADRRLAAALIPRFVPQHPDLCGSAATALLAVCDGRRSPPSPDVDSVSKQSKLTALRGLEAVVLVAGKGAGDAGRPVQSKVVEFLIR